MLLTRSGCVAITNVLLAAGIIFFGPTIEQHARAQLRSPPFVNQPPPPPPPVFNPSTPYTVPNPKETPVSPGSPSTSGTGLGAELPPAKSPCNLLSGRPCHPSFCSVFHLGPCFPQYLPPIGQDLRLTIVSTDDDASANKSNAGDIKSGDDANKAANEKPLDSIGEMYAALRACWTPPPKDEARHGMQYTILFAFKRDGEIIAPPRRTYSSHAAPAEVRDAYRDAVEAALKRCTPLHFSAGMAGAMAGRPIAMRFVDERTLANSIDETHSLQ